MYEVITHNTDIKKIGKGESVTVLEMEGQRSAAWLEVF